VGGGQREKAESRLMSSENRKIKPECSSDKINSLRFQFLLAQFMLGFLTPLRPPRIFET
jgi:hypothetical protein